MPLSNTQRWNRVSCITLLRTQSLSDLVITKHLRRHTGVGLKLVYNQYYKVELGKYYKSLFFIYTVIIPVINTFFKRLATYPR